MGSNDLMLRSFAPSPDDIRVGYYQRIADGDPKIPVDELVFVTRADEFSVSFLCGESSYRCDLDKFAAAYRFCPDGEKRRDAEMRYLAQEGELDRQETVQMQSLLLASEPELLSAPNGEADTEEEGDSSGARLVRLGAEHVSPGEARQRLRGFRNDVLKFEQRMEVRAARMRALMTEARERVVAQMREQQAALIAQMEGLKEIVGRAEEAITTINVYLGTNETLVQLRDGAAASEEEQIAIYQAVRYMDEECALYADEGGIDADDLPAFEEWILMPGNIDRLISAPRGILAMQPRRHVKKYSFDPLEDVLINKEKGNFETHFFLRNGEKLYRLVTDLQVGSTLIPRMREFEELFEVRDRSGADGEVRVARLKPGTDEYLKAMKEADARTRHYMRVMLFLQGVLDRTPVYQPLPAPQINILDLRNQDRYIRFIADAEESNLLPLERPPFHQWLTSVNAELSVGMRVVGCFDHYTQGLRQYHRERGYGNERLHPSQSPYPSSKAIHTLEKKNPDGTFSFLYQRVDDWREFERRASCKIRPSDRFILNFDSAQLEDLQFYIGSRYNRTEYEAMLPILKLAIQLKKQEILEEEPFLVMVTGALMRDFGASLEDATTEASELISWWKQKNRLHRALLSGSDDQAAREILTEARLNREKADARLKYPEAEIARAILAAQPDALLVGHKTNNQFVALVPENDENYFLREQTWTATLKGTVRLVEEKRWRTPAKRMQRWHVYHESERWSQWERLVHPGMRLTDPEIDELFEVAGERVRKIADLHGPDARVWRESERVPNYEFRPMSAIWNSKDQSIYYWVWINGTSRSRHVLSETLHPTRVLRVRVRWQRENGVPVPQIGYSDWETYFDDTIDPLQVKIPYRSLGRTELVNGAPEAEERILWKDDETIEAYYADRKDGQAIKELQYALGRLRNRLMKEVQQEVDRRIEAAAFGEFMEEYGDIELWPSHLKRLRLPGSPHAERFGRAVELLLERDIVVEGRTVGEILEIASEFGFEPSDRDADAGAIPMDYRIQVSE